ncbi:MAG: hypothetical protein HFH35_13590 [Eubacterium sp.]|nr:hypothetical protein [Eubacterium sp.]
MDIDNQIVVMEHLKRKAKRESGRKRGMRNNLFYKAARLIQSLMLSDKSCSIASQHANQRKEMKYE